MNTVFIIDKVSGEIVWHFSEGLDFQHEALMIPHGTLAGKIILFNNGLGDSQIYRRSRVQIFDPQTLEKVWEYSAPFFFSSVEGLAQPLWNGNFMVASSRGGRVFEVEPEGDIVWQWEPPYDPMRPIRYPRDHCPQLEDLDWQPSVARARTTPYLDTALYDFLLPMQPSRQLEGWDRKALKESLTCRRLIIPPDATMRLTYCLHQEAMNRSPFAARFIVDIRDTVSGEMTRVLEDEVQSKRYELPREATVSLASYAFALTEVCLDAQPLGTTEGAAPLEAMVWLEPKIESGSRAHSDAEEDFTQAEHDLRQWQLRTLGYVE